MGASRTPFLSGTLALLLVAFAAATAGAVAPYAGVVLVAAWLVAALAAPPPLPGEPPRAAAWAVGLVIGVGVLQLLPLPEPVRALLAPGPTTARRDLADLGLQGRWMPISVDLGRGVVETLYWVGAGALLFVVGRRQGPPAALRATVFALVVLQVLTWLDRLLGTHLFPLTRLADPWGVGQENLRGVTPFSAWLLNRNHAAALGLVLAPLCAWWAWTRPRLAARCLGALATVAVLLSVLWTQSRAGQGGVALELLVLVGFLARRLTWRGRLALGGTLVLALVLGRPVLAAYVERVTSGDDVGRADLYRAVAHMATDSPIVGWGLGTFRFVFPAYQPDTLLYRYSHAHQDLLQIATDAGLVGLLAVGLLLFHLVRSLRRREVPVGARWAWACALGGGALVSMVEFPLQIPALRFLWLGLLFAGPAALPPPRPVRGV